MMKRRALASVILLWLVAACSLPPLRHGRVLRSRTAMEGLMRGLHGSSAALEATVGPVAPAVVDGVLRAERLPPSDEWGNAWVVVRLRSGFIVASPGPDRAFQTDLAALVRELSRTDGAPPPTVRMQPTNADFVLYNQFYLATEIGWGDEVTELGQPP